MDPHLPYICRPCFGGTAAPLQQLRQLDTAPFSVQLAESVTAKHVTRAVVEVIYAVDVSQKRFSLDLH